MTMFTRFVPLDDIRIRSGGDGRTVEAYAAIFNTPAEMSDVDGSYQEQIAPGAFTKTLQERAAQIGVFYNHGRSIDGFPSDRYSMPLGVVEEIRPDAKGLLTVTRYSRTDLADEVLEGIRMGAIRGQSFSGMFTKSAPRSQPPRGGYHAGRDGSLPLITRTEIALREYGPTPFPAYEGAGIVGVRAALASLLTSGGLQLDSASTSGTTPGEPDPTSATPTGAGAQADEPQMHSARLRAHIRAARIARQME
jgi:HK97 family phage prohead protease